MGRGAKHRGSRGKVLMIDRAERGWVREGWHPHAPHKGVGRCELSHWGPPPTILQYRTLQNKLWPLTRYLISELSYETASLSPLNPSNVIHKGLSFPRLWALQALFVWGAFARKAPPRGNANATSQGPSAYCSKSCTMKLCEAWQRLHETCLQLYPTIKQWC